MFFSYFDSRGDQQLRVSLSKCAIQSGCGDHSKQNTLYPVYTVCLVWLGVPLLRTFCHIYDDDKCNIRAMNYVMA